MRTKYLVAAVLWLASLFAVNAWARGQAQEFVRAPEPTIFSGSDVGFRIEGRIGGDLAGTIVIRVNGKWIVPREAPGGVRFLGKPTE
jgi:hypothetical protein